MLLLMGGIHIFEIPCYREICAMRGLPVLLESADSISYFGVMRWTKLESRWFQRVSCILLLLFSNTCTYYCKVIFFHTKCFLRP